jgi:enamine deaminase RidA (YjgF/YER057c/UK114 family)
MTKKRTTFTTGAPWEDIVGYSRAIRVGDTIEISGTIALDEAGNSLAVGDPYQQTLEIIRIAERMLQKAGSGLTEVVRTRIYVTDITRWEEVGRAHGEFFRDILPATSMVQVSALIRPESLVEIEFTAIAGD